MLKRLAELLTKFPRITIAIFLAITIFFAFQIPGVEVNTELTNQVPEDLPAQIRLDKIEDLFGGTEAIIVSLADEDILKTATLERAKKIADKLEAKSGVESVKSPFNIQHIKGQDDQLDIEDTIKELPETNTEKQQLKEKIKDNDFVYGSLIAENFEALAMVVILEEDAKDEVIVEDIKQVMSQVSGDETEYIAGLPAARAEIGRNVKKDMRILLPIGLLIMLVFLYFCFRQLRGVLLPFLVVIMSIIIAMGSLSWLNWEIQLVTIVLPIALIAIANDYGIHIIAHYQEINKPELKISEQKMAQRLVTKLGYPIITTGITTVIGFLLLLVHVIVPVKQLGVLAAVGIVFALLASLIFIPAALVLLPRAKPRKTEGENLLENLLNWTGKQVTTHPKKIIAGALIMTIIVSSGIFLIEVDTNPINYFPSEKEIVKSTEFVNQNFGGTNNISIVAQGELEDPEVMKDISQLEKDLTEYENIGEVTAISRIMPEDESGIKPRKRKI